MFALPVKQKQEGGLKQKALSILGSARTCGVLYRDERYQGA